MYPLVSIVFTSYNHKEFLSQAIDSLVNQTYKNFELIIVDDCSTDGSQEILKKYKADYPFLNLFLLEKNTGSYVKASNYGARQASGKYLLFAQCDDYSEKNQIEKLVQALDQNPSVGIAYSCSNLVDKNGTILKTDYELRSKEFKEKCGYDTLINGKLMQRFLTHSCVIPNLSAAMIKKELFIEAGGLSEQYLVASDWAFWLEMAQTTNFYYITEKLNNFRQHDTTIRSSIKATKQLSEFYTIFFNHVKKYEIEFIQSLSFRIGAARIWLLYYFEDKKSFKQTFKELFRQFVKLDKFLLLSLSCASYKIVSEIFVNKLRKSKR